MLKKNHKVAILAYDGLCTFEFAVAIEVFGLKRSEMDSWYDCFVCGLESGPLTATGGVTVTTNYGLDVLERADTIILPGWRGMYTKPPEELLQQLLKAYDRGSRILTICSGIFVLAHTGLLDGKSATTHWQYTDYLASRFPAIRVEPDVLYIDEGQLVSSAGSAAGLDMCLHIVRKDYGPEIANKVARRLVIPPHRDGGQAQFIERPLPGTDHRLAGLLDWIRENLQENLTVQSLAKRVSMSKRTLERKFRGATGQAPGQWVVEQRLSLARNLLAASSQSIESIAFDSGFGSAELLRHHFRKRLGLSPLAYRRRFAYASDFPSLALKTIPEKNA